MIVFVLCLITTYTTYAQLTDGLQFEHLDVDDGLPSSTIYTVFQDSKGYIWFGTGAGLSRYDGYRFKNYSIANNLPANDVFRLLEDSLGRLWVSSMGSLAYLENGEFTRVYFRDSTSTRLLYSLYLDTNNNIAFTSKLENYYIDQNYTIHNNSFPLPPEPNQIIRTKYNLNWSHIDDSGNAWFSYGPYVLNNQNPAQILKFPSDRPNFPRCIHPEGDKQFLYNAIDGLFRWLDDSSELILPSNPHFQSSSIYKIIEDQQKRLWISNLVNGVCMLDTNQVAHYYLPNERVGNSLMDKDGNLWFPTLGNGVYYLPPENQQVQRYTTESGLSDNNIQSIYLHQDSSIFLGLSNGQINRLYPKIQKIEKHYLNEASTVKQSYLRVLDFASMGNGDIALATDENTYFFHKGKMEPLGIKSPSKSLFADTINQVLWITSANWFYIFPFDSIYTNNTPPIHPKFNQNMHSSFHKKKIRAYAVQPDFKGGAWIGNHSGLYYYSPDDKLSSASKEPLLQKSITDIILCPDSLMWIATEGYGLVIKKGDQLKQISIDEGLNHPICKTLAISGKEIWVGTNGGIYAIKNYQFDSHTYDLSYYNNKDGIISNSINDLVVTESELLIATNKGLCIFPKHSNDANTSSDLPIYLTNININGQDSIILDHYKLDYWQNDIEFTFTALSYQNINEITYYYQLDGLDSDFTITQSTEARYAALKPGDYRFRLFAVAKKGQKRSKEIDLSFSIKLPFWKTAWFWILAIVSTIGITYSWLRLIISEQQNKVLAVKIDEKTQELQSKVLELKRTNSRLREFAHIASHDLKEPLRTILGFVQLLEIKFGHLAHTDAKSYIGYITVGIQRMENLIDALLKYAHINNSPLKLEKIDTHLLLEELANSLTALLKRKNAQVHYENMPIILADDQQIRQIFQNLIQNGIKFNKNAIPTINIKAVDKETYWEFSVKDNGIGIAPKYQEQIFTIFNRLHNQNEFEGTGIGLSLCQRIVERHGGRIWLDSDTGLGTTFYFTITKK